MSAIVLTLIATPAAQAQSSGGVEGAASTTAAAAYAAVSAASPDSSSAPDAGVLPDKSTLVSADSGDVARSVTLARSGAVHCRSHRRGLIYYRLRTNAYLALRGVERDVNLSQPHGCAHALWAAKQWRAKARTARLAYRAWRESQWVLREQRTWRAAVEHVQKVFPGTSGWLMSCSKPEGGWGVWKRFGGDPYYKGYEYTDAVGSWMQYRWSTFKGHYRNALVAVLSRGYRIPPELRDPGNVRSWLSPLAVALAAGWARFTGNDNSHWSASWGSGC